MRGSGSSQPRRAKTCRTAVSNADTANSVPITFLQIRRLECAAGSKYGVIPLYRVAAKTEASELLLCRRPRGTSRSGASPTSGPGPRARRPPACGPRPRAGGGARAPRPAAAAAGTPRGLGLARGGDDHSDAVQILCAEVGYSLLFFECSTPKAVPHPCEFYSIRENRSNQRS